MSVEKISRGLESKEIREAIVSQLKIKHIIESNTKIVKEMSEGIFNKNKFQKFSKDNNLNIIKTTIKNIKNETVFTSSVIREIFKINDGDLSLLQIVIYQELHSFS